VRGLTNRSSGKMGFAIARAALEAGATVHLIAGPVSLETPLAYSEKITRVNVLSAADMYAAVMAQQDCDLFFSVAAVADWRVHQTAEQKIKKQDASDIPSFDLVQNPDILSEFAQRSVNHHPFCIGFAAETQNIIDHGKKKLIAKNIPLLIANHGPSTFGEDHNQVTLIDAQGETHIGPANKLSLARDLIREVSKRL